ncbi:methyltransferase domain-containing protein [Candidatus Woesearchaeota archaeon]|nr:methyltransferase domain-containing protein [Candidatus Woesearchaeota archaeon]
MKQNFVYKSPTIYNIYLRCSLPLRALSKRLKLISRLVGENKTVLDVACGPAHLYEFLDKSTKYSGFDLNKRFIDYANKKFKLNLKVGNATDPKMYDRNDIIIILDILHHLTPDQRTKVVELAFSNSDKVIICEPFLPEFFKKKGLLVRLARKIFEYFEKDGFNRVTVDIGLYKDELRQSLEEYKKNRKLEIIETTGYLVGIYTKR